jgi:hypothetical protein
MLQGATYATQQSLNLMLFTWETSKTLLKHVAKLVEFHGGVANFTQGTHIGLLPSNIERHRKMAATKASFSKGCWSPLSRDQPSHTAVSTQ